MSPTCYRYGVRPLFFALPAETAHHVGLNALRFAARFETTLHALRVSFPQPDRPVQLFGLTFPNPVGLAAGFDKNGLAIPAFAALGFGFVEIGTVTAQAQPGNPAPRIFRYPGSRPSSIDSGSTTRAPTWSRPGSAACA